MWKLWHKFSSRGEAKKAFCVFSRLMIWSQGRKFRSSFLFVSVSHFGVLFWLRNDYSSSRRIAATFEFFSSLIPTRPNFLVNLCFAAFCFVSDLIFFLSRVTTESQFRIHNDFLVWRNTTSESVNIIDTHLMDEKQHRKWENGNLKKSTYCRIFPFTSL